MARHLRIVYASRSTFPPIRDGAGIHPEVARILVQSRRNNARHRIYGGLYFADGSFFQCLEGREAEVQALYERLERPDVAPPGEAVPGLEPAARRMFFTRIAVATGLVAAVGAAAASWLR